MKRTMRKDLFRTITKSIGRFLSIFLIVALGCGFFAGVKAAGPDMRETADRYYDDTGMMDIHLVSELGFSKENAEAMADIQGVLDVMPGLMTTMETENGGITEKIRVQSISAGTDWAELNRLTVIRGRMPQTSGECVIDDRAVTGGAYSIGQEITLKAPGSDGGGETEASGSEEGLLAETAFTIVGTANSPMYIAFSSGGLGSREPDYNIFVPAEAFSKNVFTDIYIRVSGTDTFNCYEDQYKDRVDEVLSGVKEEGAVQSDARRSQIISEQLGAFSVPEGVSPEAAAAAKAAAEAALEDMTNKWYYLTRDSVSGYSAFDDNASRIDAIATIFPVFFFAVAALVSLTAMTRMVDEERMQIGSMKALGYARHSIALKYVAYAAAASILGGLAGVAAGFELFPRIIYNAYLIMYQLPPIDPPFRPELAWFTLAIAVVCTASAALVALLASLHVTPAGLLRPKAPKIGKRVLLERIPVIWHRIGFVWKVTIRNLMRYKKRFLMTVTGIAGCTALILTGFGIRNSVSGLVEKQYGEIMLYDLQVVFADPLENAEDDVTVTWLRDSAEVRDMMPVSADMADVISAKEPDAFEASLIVPTDPQGFSGYVNIRTRVGRQILPLSDDGVIITEKLSRLKSVRKGGTITLKGIHDSDVSVRVSGICENYTGHYIYMTPGLYEKLYGEAAPINAVFAKLADKSDSAIDNFQEKLLEQPNIAGALFVPLMKTEMGDAFASLDYVVVVLILSAFALAMIVLYSLTNINIHERIREIATLKVLGFFDGEVSAYVYRENGAITFVGALLGLGLGALLHGFVIETAETDDIMFGRTIGWSSFLIAFILTLVFSLMVNVAMHFYLKRIRMVESLKSIE